MTPSFSEFLVSVTSHSPHYSSTLLATYQFSADSFFFKLECIQNHMLGEQDGGEVGGYVVHLSSWIYHKYTFRHRSACRTPTENGQEYLTRGKKYIEPWKTGDQALSLCSGSTKSKTLDYQRTNPREYQIGIQRKPLEYKTQHHPTTSSTLCRMPHLNNKQNKYTKQSSADRVPPHSAFPIRGKTNKQTNAQHKSQPIGSLHKPLDQT